MTSPCESGLARVVRSCLDLDEVQAPRRFEQWREWMAEMIDVLPPRHLPERPYQGRLQIHGVGDITVSRCHSDAMLLRRSLARISTDCQRGYVFQYYLGGAPGVVRVRGRETLVRRGDLLAIDFEQPIEMERPAYEAVGIFVPRAVMEPLLRGADIHGRVAGTAHGLGALTAGWLGQYLQQIDELGLAEARQGLAALLPLLAGCHAAPDALAAGSAAPGLAGGSLLPRLLAFIEQHRDDPELSPALLQRHFGLSRRQLYMAFQGSEQGPAALIRRYRLAAAREELVQRPDMPVIDIAFASGFHSLSDFGRAFRREYGLSPSELRSSARGHAARRTPLAVPQPYGRHLGLAPAR